MTKRSKDLDILSIDIETAPMLSYHWQPKTEYIGHAFNIQPTTIICCSFRDPRTKKLTTYRIDPRHPLDDKAMLKKVHALLAYAGKTNKILLYQNGDHFDIPKLEARFIIHRFPPLPRFVSIDTLKEARKFGFDYKRLDYLDKVLHGEDKGKLDDGGFETWKAIVASASPLKTRRKALELMVRYCEGDIVVLERVYQTMRRYMKVHPNMNLWHGTRSHCPTCHGPAEYRGRPVFTPTLAYRRMQCTTKACRRWFREKRPLSEFKTTVTNRL